MTKISAEVGLKLLSALEGGEVTTQRSLSRHIGVSTGLVNALLKRAMGIGYVRSKAIAYKRNAYYLTPSGFSEKNRLLADHLEASLSFFRNAREQYADGFRNLQVRGLRRVVLAGATELAQIAMLSADERNIEVVAIVDAESNRSQLTGLPVLRTLREAPAYDALVLTDVRAPQVTYDRLARELAPDRILAPALLHVSTKTAGLERPLRDR